MILKVNDENDKTITIVQVATIEYEYKDKKTLEIWDVADNCATLTPQI